ncbi:hypothetical protein BC830DRAFT_1175733 [Chytriomyces sp. MP71]|nr:hypothetical protein BC830DRAFT_1175733 [Chytriomyces sp. MP71]
MSHIPSILGRSSSRDTFTPQREASILLSVLQFAPGPEKGIPAGAFAQTDVPAFVMSPVPVPGQMAGSGAPEKILQVFQNLSAAPLPPVYTDLDAKKLAIRDEKMAYRNEKEGYKEVNAGLAAMQVSEKSGGSRVPLSEWNIDHVTEWILAIPSLDSAEEVARLFKAQEIDGSVLLELSEDDLKNEIGITHLARRRKVIGAIQRLKNGEL